MSHHDWPRALAQTLQAHDVDPATAPAFKRLLELLRDDPTAPTTVTDPMAAVSAHVGDSLAALALPEVREAAHIADLGSGGGFPGLPLALALPHAQVHLIESLSRKCAFLELAVEAAGATNTVVVCRRVEDWDGRDLDIVTARAVASLAVLVEYAAPLLRVGGTLVAWKGRRDAAEEADGRAAAAVTGLEAGEILEVPARRGADYHTLHLYSKVRETPEKFPRRAGMARKRPLSA